MHEERYSRKDGENLRSPWSSISINLNWENPLPRRLRSSNCLGCTPYRELPSTLQQRWLKYERNLPCQVTVPRSLAKPEEPIKSIELHAFGDASGIGVSAAVYAIVQQPSSVSSGLVTAKSRLAKKGLTIPSLELVSGHMATNLVHNVKESLEGFPVQRVVGWLDSTVALHWIRGNGEFKQFVGIIIIIIIICLINHIAVETELHDYK